jgi:hypothetical protein
MRIPNFNFSADPIQSIMPERSTGGLFRLHGKDLNRLQRFLDPAMITVIFVAAAAGSSVPLPSTSLTIFLLTALILPAGKLYRSYRQTSLWVLARRVSISWALVLTGLLLLGFLLKLSANFSRLDMTLWAVLGWFLLLLHHVGKPRLAQAQALGLGPPVLPNNSVVNGLAGVAPPHQRGFALVGDAHCGDLLGIQP